MCGYQHKKVNLRVGPNHEQLLLLLLPLFRQLLQLTLMLMAVLVLVLVPDLVD